MQRRKYLAALGSAAAGGAAMMGTGAVTSVSADRTITVKTAGDANAYLGLEPQGTPNSDEFVEVNNNGTIEIDVSDTDAGGAGANKEAFTIIRNLILVTNQGTQGFIFGHQQDFDPQDVFAFHDDPRYKPGGSKQQAGEVFSSLSGPDNSGTNIDTIATKNLPYIEAGDGLNNFGIGIGIGSDDPALTDGTITFIAATDPDELP